MSTMTMQDVADLASVSRQAVSMWRRRPMVRGVSMPFPSPVETIGGVEHFRGNEIIDWLARTGRGNTHDDLALDAPALTVPSGVQLEDVVTLLAWHELTGLGVAETATEDRIAAAVEVDAEDRVLLSEIRSLDESAELLTFTDDLIEASFGPADQLDRLEAGRLGRERGLRDLNHDGVAIVRALTTAAGAHLGVENLAVRAVGDPAVALAVTESGGQFTTPDDVPGRAARRRAVLRGADIGDSRNEQAVIVASLLGLEVDEALDLLDEVVIELVEGEIAIVIGAAAVLTDSMRGERLGRRAETLSVGNLIAALRLPRGMWREAHRQSIAAWVCQGKARPTAVHLADVDRVTEDDLGDLTADLAGAFGRTARRSYRFTRLVSATDVALARSVVPRGIAAPVVRGAARADHIDRVHRATLTTAVPPEPLDILVAPSRATFVLNRQSLGEMSDRKELRVMRRSRINSDHADPAGTVRVWPELSFALDPIDAERLYPRASRTEAGDVIFIERPVPHAWVDEDGGALVASPARILRLRNSAVVGPHLIAAVINTMVGDGSEWRTWRVPIPDAAEARRLESALATSAAYQQELRARLAAATDLGSALIEGVAAGALTLDVADTTAGVIVPAHDKRSASNYFIEIK